MNRTEGMLEQGKALVRAIEALETIEPTGPIERTMAALLVQAYRYRLRAVVVAAPGWLAEEVLSAGQGVGWDREAV
jgi:hypothetical protein